MNENQLSFEASQKLWVDYMVNRIYHNMVYPNLNIMPVLSYEEWRKPDMYFIDGINKKELPFRCNGKEYLSNQIETFTEWYNKI